MPIVNDALGLTQSGMYSVPALMHVGVVLDALLMAGQGVKHVIAYAMLAGHARPGHRGLPAVRSLTEEYLARFGFDDVRST